MNIRQQSTDRDYKTLKAGQTCEIISIIEKIMSIIGLDRLELWTCIAVARSIVHTGALVGLLVTCQSFIPALDEDVCLEAPVNWAALP